MKKCTAVSQESEVTPHRNTILQLSTTYTDPSAMHNAHTYIHIYIHTDRQTDDSMMPIADHTACYCTVWTMETSSPWVD